jgi:hypothetical protein
VAIGSNVQHRMETYSVVERKGKMDGKEVSSVVVGEGVVQPTVVALDDVSKVAEIFVGKMGFLGLVVVVVVELLVW